VHGIAHTASPFHFASEDPKGRKHNLYISSTYVADSHGLDIIDPAVNGTIGILESVNKYGSDVKRVVVTSSAASVTDGMYHLKIPGTIYTEVC
jgi:nucleoside-diphosphate-sugar epimerase